VMFNEILLLQDFSLYVTGKSFININWARLENGTEKLKNNFSVPFSSLAQFIFIKL